MPSDAREQALDGRGKGFFELRFLAARQQHVIRRDAGLPGVEQLAVGNLDSGVIEVAGLVDDAGRLAAELQRHRRQVGGGFGSDLAPDGGGAGEEQVVERQAGEPGGQRGVALDHAELVGIEGFVHQTRHQFRGARREFAGLEHDAVACRQRGGRRRQGQLHRIVPRRDDAHNAQRLPLDIGGGGLEVDRCGHLDRLDPARQVLVQVADEAAQQEQVGHLGEVARAHAKVGLHRVAQGLAVAVDEPAQAPKAVAPQGQGHVDLGAAGLVLGVKEGVHGQGKRVLGHADDDRTGTPRRLEQDLQPQWVRCLPSAKGRQRTDVHWRPCRGA